MTTINLKLGYFIESKKLSYNLKKKYIGKDKSGNPKEAVKTVGYFGSMEQAIDCYLKEVVSDTLDGEEMAELTVAINKFWRKLGDGQRVNKSASECIQNLVEEIADVQVMLEQIKYLLSIREDEVSDIIEQKLDRQIERIKNEVRRKE